MGEVLSQGEFDEILKVVQQKVEQFEPLFKTFCKAVQEACEGTWDWVYDKIKTGLEFLWKWIKKIYGEIWNFWTQPGVPWTLWSHGSSWVDDVGAKASHWQDSMQWSQMATSYEWKGTAAQAYKDVLPLQQKALGAIREVCAEMDDSLTLLAIGIGAVWAAILGAVISFVAELITEAGGIATVAAAIAAIAAALGSCAKVWGLIMAALTAFETLVGTVILVKVKDLGQRLGNSDGFPQDHWPKSVRNLGNGSMKNTDNDPNTSDIDWEMSQA